MTEEDSLLQQREAGFDEFYGALLPSLVEFVGNMGITPAHEVLKHAVAFAPMLSESLREVDVSDQEDRSWLILHAGYFIGEFFVQRYRGCWYVNDIQGSRYFARYVVGRFLDLNNSALMIDPFFVAQSYVDSSAPRNLEEMLSAVNAELCGDQR
ncbi:hypothetical protein [Luteibacter sp. 22Crub2.1]|uniref:hypothetical protein n=1 Tax=Luteibacter sp. 22Crub2.1 TaxID=1283288 RepID=UPI00111778FA|nr:hypothetical protein [Luteibacter sp. 22Crub2.1]